KPKYVLKAIKSPNVILPSKTNFAPKPIDRKKDIPTQADIVGSYKESTLATAIFFSTTSSESFLKSFISSFSWPKVFITLIPDILSWVLSFKKEKASCAFLKRACNFVPYQFVKRAMIGIGRRAINV